jgi:hypothetical protein
VTYDGGDLIRVALPNEETVLIYLIESPMTVSEIGGIVKANTLVGAYTLFVLWSDLLLPAHGIQYVPKDWIEALLTLHGEKIYAFDAFYGDELYIFPVYFQATGRGRERIIRHGGAIDATKLIGDTVQTASPLIAGVWRVASFEPSEDTAPHVSPVLAALGIYFRRLGIMETTDRAAIKRAFRQLARKYHPDLSTDPDATLRMQKINEAYQRIIEVLDQEKA